MKAYAVSVGLLVGLVGTGCPSDTFLCENVQDCIDNENSCPSGQELFCNYELGGVCDCADGAGGTGGTAGTGGTGGAASCVLDVECSPIEISDCDTPCQSFCGSSGTEAYGQCGTNVDPSQPPPDAYYCVCYCGNEACP